MMPRSSVCKCVCLCVCIYVCVYVFMCVYICVCICVCVCEWIHMRISWCICKADRDSAQSNQVIQERLEALGISLTTASVEQMKQEEQVHSMIRELEQTQKFIEVTSPLPPSPPEIPPPPPPPSTPNCVILVFRLAGSHSHLRSVERGGDIAVQQPEQTPWSSHVGHSPGGVPGLRASTHPDAPHPRAPPAAAG